MNDYETVATSTLLQALEAEDYLFDQTFAQEGAFRFVGETYGDGVYLIGYESPEDGVFLIFKARLDSHGNACLYDIPETVVETADEALDYIADFDFELDFS